MNKLGRIWLLAALLLLLAAADAAHAETLARNADDLSRLLRQHRPTLRLKPVEAVQGCGSGGCSVMLGSIAIDLDAGDLRRRSGAPLAWALDGAVGVADLPEVNWTPLNGFTVLRGGRAWGECMEFSHAGLGNSGRAQRWRTLVLVAAGSRSALRITGYWAACAALAQGSTSAEVLLPTVEPVAIGEAALQIVWHRCALRGCVRSVDARRVEGRADSESGQLTLQP